MILKINLASFFLASLALIPLGNAAQDSGVYFGKARSVSSEYISAYRDFYEQGRFFSSSDYGSEPGQPYLLTGKEYGITFWLGRGDLYVRGKAGGKLPRFSGTVSGWLSDALPCKFGMKFEKPFVTTWAKDIKGPDQFSRFPGNQPLFDQIVVYWGHLTPAKGTLRLKITNADGKVIQVNLADKTPIYPYDWTTIDFPPTTVKSFEFEVANTRNEKSYINVMALSLNLYNEKSIDNRVSVWQHDAYGVAYSWERPGTLTGIEVLNLYFSPSAPSDITPEKCAFTDLSPYIQLKDARIYASPGKYPVEVYSSEREYVLAHELEFAIPGGKSVKVCCTATYSVDLKTPIKLAYKADSLPNEAKLGFEIFAQNELFPGSTQKNASKGGSSTTGALVFKTLAGEFRIIPAENEAISTEEEGRRKRFEIVARGNELGLTISLPFGPAGGVQPDSLKYEWYSALAGPANSEEGIAPFRMEDLELQETIDLSDPNAPYVIYDITNDPLVASWRGKDRKDLPKELGTLYHLASPENGRVPQKEVLGSKCRVINNLETTYFRFNLKSRFEPQTPYLIVVEHAFDKERRGGFYALGLNQQGDRIADSNLWKAPNPMGGFDTGTPPHDNRFHKESVFFLHPKRTPASSSTVFSLCFSNMFSYNHVIGLLGEKIPEGLAVRSVSIYRIKKMPQLPDISPLLPEGKLRHITVGTEITSPYALSEFPRLAGYDSLWANNQPPAQYLTNTGSYGTRPGSGLRWYPGTLHSQSWLFDEAQKRGLYAKISEASLLDIGFEGTNYFTNAARTINTSLSFAPPLSPTKEELEHLAKGFNRSLAELASYRSFRDIQILADLRGFFTWRNLSDFNRETNSSVAATPVPLENMRRLLASDTKTVEKWMRWASRKRYEYLSWLLDLARKHRPDIYLSINQSADTDTFREAFEEGAKVVSWMVYLDKSVLTKQGIKDYNSFLKFIAHDAELYADQDGFNFGLGKERNRLDSRRWESPYAIPGFERIKKGFSAGGLSISSSQYEEGAKPLKNWICNYVRDQKSYRRDLVEGLLYANAREFFFDTYYYDAYRGRLNDLRTFAVPFRLLPFAPPQPFAGSISDPAKKAAIYRYGNRLGLLNPSDAGTTVILALPNTAKSLDDLSSGVRERLKVERGKYRIELEPWSLRTLEQN